MEQLKLTEEQKTKVIREIREGLTLIQTERDAEALETKWQNIDDLYHLIVEDKDFPWEDAANYCLPDILSAVDTVTSEGKRQTFSVRPIIILENNEDESISQDEIEEREDNLEFWNRNIIKAEDVIIPVYREAAKQGTAWVQVYFDEENEEILKDEIYEPTIEDIQKFREKYAIDLTQDKQDIVDKYLRLIGGEKLKLTKSELLNIYRGPRLGYVALPDLFVRPSIKDLRRHRLIAHRFKMFWQDIDYRKETGFYDKKAVDELKEKNVSDYFDKDFTVYQCILNTDIETEGKYKRYIFTIEDTLELILRAIPYPYEHRQIFYVPYYIKPRPDSIYGYGLGEILEDSNLMDNSLANIAFNSATIANAPIVHTRKGSGFDAHYQKLGPLSVIETEKMDDLKFLEMSYPKMDTVNLLSYFDRVGEKASGISGLASGRETPLDPRAPAQKTGMLLQRTSLRIEDYVTELQKSNSIVAEQCEKILVQYNEKISYFKEGTKKEVDKNLLTKKVRYIPHGLNVSFNRAFEAQGILELMNVMSKFYPEGFKDEKTRYTLMKEYINCRGGIVERRIKDILKSPDELKVIMLKKLLDEIKLKQVLTNIQPQPAPLMPNPQTPVPQGGTF